MFLYDGINLKEYEKISEWCPLSGLTSNPSIINKSYQQENVASRWLPKTLIEEFLKITSNTTHPQYFFYQLVGNTCDEQIAFFDKYCKESVINSDLVSIKIMGGEEGLKTMTKLSKQGISTSATGIYTSQQALLALNAGVKFIIPYYNRMLVQGIDVEFEIEKMRQYAELFNAKIIAASFKSIDQVMRAFQSGAHYCTISSELFSLLSENIYVDRDKLAFQNDWDQYVEKCTRS